MFVGQPWVNETKTSWMAANKSGVINENKRFVNIKIELLTTMFILRSKAFLFFIIPLFLILTAINNWNCSLISCAKLIPISLNYNTTEYQKVFLRFYHKKNESLHKIKCVNIPLKV